MAGSSKEKEEIHLMTPGSSRVRRGKVPQGSWVSAALSGKGLGVTLLVFKEK